jgi:hypothetical protein
MLTHDPTLDFFFAGPSKYPTTGTASTAPTSAFNPNASLNKKTLRVCAAALPSGDKTSFSDSPGYFRNSLILVSVN